MVEAFKRVKSNKGAGGVDGIEIEGFKTQLDGTWNAVKTAILGGRYQPEAVRRVEIPKPNGGIRLLGIPTLMDRLIQQAIGQELVKLYDESFSESSYGFRPGKSAHQAVVQAKEYVNAGYSHVVDLDLDQFFDRVNHDYLMNLLSQRIEDKRVLKLIHRYLRAGVMKDGIVKANTTGMPQGGPLSPILSNILLDVLDKELENRGHRFIRYADDCSVYVKTKRAGERVMVSISKFIEKELKLKVNEVKSAVTRPWKTKLLGYSFYSAKGEKRLKIAKESISKYKDKIREITSRSKPFAMYRRYELLRQLNVGWYNYFHLNEARSVIEELDEWVRRRIRLCYWKQWPRVKTRIKELEKMGVPSWKVYQWGNTRKGYWRIANSPILKTTLNKTFLQNEGYLSLTEISSH